ncbi:DUF455 domain-containing protein [Chloropicon primus]|uniref:DUF455 domain-containing protein n=2 Tax=Chloropicon primus TaxID=1764295 RepID=A0A5B8MVL1_9CHLO|nr:DUF455 domain-containing protein [Chloropicon primus]|eukprot:QDZ23552.1 DUF455 domain-containing protein [Chloropicon primus]
MLEKSLVLRPRGLGGPAPSRSRRVAVVARCPSSSREALALTWDGFGDWRTAPVRDDVEWGEAGSAVGDLEVGDLELSPGDGVSLSELGKRVLETTDVLEKAVLTHGAYKAFARSRIPVGRARGPDQPGRPRLPRLVPPRECPSPKRSGLCLSSYMLHNLAHIELNAIDLAWDTVVSFSGLELPVDFYHDFLRVADDESRHLRWCLQRLEELDSFYGAMPAHDLLWQAGKATRADLLARLVAIPMVQEARGLDAGPRLVAKLRGAADSRSADIVEKIAFEERAHVAVGVYWFHYFCREKGVLGEEAIAEEFQRIAASHARDMIRGPFDLETRELVGLPKDWFLPLAATTNTTTNTTERGR